jgi:hypothetical protein
VIEKESGDPGAPEPHSKVLDCGDLRVAFYWRGDRFGHFIEQHIGGKWCTVLESLEGSPDDVWPPSPTLQSLHIERRASGPVALLVGKSGANHWSASIELLAARLAMQFDIACRVQSPPQRLGTVYRCADSSSRRIVQVDALPQDAICEFVELHEMRGWHVQPFAAPSEYPCTIRWRYTISLDNRTD